MALIGSCACRKVRYRILGPFIEPVTYCHCWRCRKHSGSSFGTTVGLARRHLEISEGGEYLKAWESSPGISRHFAGCCGSPLYKTDIENPEVIGFRLGTLDEDPALSVRQHYMIDARAPWVSVTDSLEKIEGGEGCFEYRQA